MFGLVSSCAFLVFYLNIVSIEKDNYLWIAYIINHQRGVTIAIRRFGAVF